jgi:hypothetical protein
MAALTRAVGLLLLGAAACNAEEGILGLAVAGSRLSLVFGGNSSVQLPGPTPVELRIMSNFSIPQCSTRTIITVANFSSFVPAGFFDARFIALQIPSIFVLCGPNTTYENWPGPFIVSSALLNTSSSADIQFGEGLLLSRGVHYTSTITDLVVQTYVFPATGPGNYCMCAHSSCGSSRIIAVMYP